MKEQQYCLRRVAGMYLLIKTNQQEKDYIHPISLNECGAMIWKGIEDGLRREELSELLQNQYEIDSKTALEAVADFVKQLEDKGLKISIVTNIEGRG